MARSTSGTERAFRVERRRGRRPIIEIKLDGYSLQEREAALQAAIGFTRYVERAQLSSDTLVCYLVTLKAPKSAREQSETKARHHVVCYIRGALANLPVPATSTPQPRPTSRERVRTRRRRPAAMPIT